MADRSRKPRLFPDVKLPRVKTNLPPFKVPRLHPVKVPEFDNIQEALRKLRRRRL